MRPRFVGRLGPADAITVANAMLGFVAAVVAPVQPLLAARLVLLAAIADGLDGVVARRVGGTPVGGYLDSLSDVSSFGVAPALLVAVVVLDGRGLSATPAAVATVGLPTLFLGMTVVRLGFYTAYDVDRDCTEGVPSTLAATVIAAAVLAGMTEPAVLLGATGLFAYLMVAPVNYPDLLARDALLMGAVQTLAVAFPAFLGRTFPFAILSLAVAYLVLAPRLYWRPEGKRS